MAEKEKVSEEKIYNVPLSAGWKKASRVRKANKAVSVLKGFVVRHTKTEDVIISEKVNQSIWSSGAKKPPSKITVKVKKEEGGKVSVRLPDEMSLEEEKKKFEEQKKARESGKKPEAEKKDGPLERPPETPPKKEDKPTEEKEQKKEPEKTEKK